MHEGRPPGPCINCKSEDVHKRYWHLLQGRNQPLFYTFVKNAYAFKDDDCICGMCEARFRKSLQMWNERIISQRGHPIDASYQVSVYLAKLYQSRRFLEIDLSEKIIVCGGHVCKQIGKK